METTELLASLNVSQRRAAEHFCGPMLVVAGAGSGKTRALTYRLANLILHHGVEPEHILAVTFTNKAAREMKERIELLFASARGQARWGKPWGALTPEQQMNLRKEVYRTVIKELWIGTFHSLFGRILRFDIDKYRDEKGRKWTRSFSIFDDSDCQALVKQIVTKQLNLDDKKFEPRSVRYAISNAKNQGLSPDEYARENVNYRGRTIAEVYRYYQDALCANNSLDFDDLLLTPVQLFEQDDRVLAYWHQKFQHILVDEYQDTNRTQYDLIRLLSAGGVGDKQMHDWQKRSIFVVGDADQSIYSFRMADFTILMDFQQDLGDGLSLDTTNTLVKLEENYRSRENILLAANALIEHNTQRIDKILKPTREAGEPIQLHQADDEIREAEFVIQQIRYLERTNPDLTWKDFAILYRTNAQSRPLEEQLVRWGIQYHIVGGLKFYDRREVKDILGYLRAIANPDDTVSILRVINTPRRGIGQTTIDNLQTAAQELGIPLWEIITDETSVKTLAGRAAKKIGEFVGILQKWKDESETRPVAEIVRGILEDSGYVASLQQEGTDEAQDRLQNLQELVNATIQFQEENEVPTLENFLANSALSSDLDSLQEDRNEVCLLTLHASKGLEFPVVFLVGLEEGLFPSYRSIDKPAALEEERRLCYVGVTRAQEILYLTHARERRLYGSREPALRSRFIAELPAELIEANPPSGKKAVKEKAPPKTATSTTKSQGKVTWEIGDRVLHATFGAGTITHIFGTGNKTSLAIKFLNIGQKIIDPRIANLEKIGEERSIES